MDALSAFASLRSGQPGVQIWNEWRVEAAQREGWQRAVVSANLDLRGIDLTSCNLSGLCLIGANLVGANLTNVDLAHADLTGAQLDGIDFRAYRINLKGTLFHGASLKNANLVECDVAAHQLAGADVSFARLPDTVDVARQLKIVEDASKNCRALFFGMLGACFFTFLTIGQTSDADLLFGSGISSLPFVGTQIPTLGFYYVAPLILCGLFLYLHLYLQQLWQLVSELPACLSDGSRVDRAIYPWLLTGLTSRYVHRLRNLPQDYGSLRWLACLVTSWLSVPLTLWYVWGRAAARHEPWLSGFHIVTLFASSMFALYSFDKMRRTLRIEAGPRGSAKERLPTVIWFLGAVAACSLAVMGTYKPLAETTTAWHQVHAVDPLQAAKDRLYRPAWAQVVGYHAFSIGVRARNVKLAGADLGHLDLRLADLTNADLAGARLTGSWLQGANLSGANLDRADLSRSSFVDTDFTGATLNEANLTGSDFIDAKGLSEPQIQSGCGAGHVRATVEGYIREYWFKLKPCRVVAERLRREQAAAEERARSAKTQVEKSAAEEEARRAEEGARRAEEQARRAQEQALQTEREAKLAVVEEQARLTAAREKSATEKTTREQPARDNPLPDLEDVCKIDPAACPNRESQPAVPFDKSAALAALSSAAGSSWRCRTDAGPRGPGRAVVTFAPTGRVTAVTLRGGSFDYEGSVSGSCLAAYFRTARVPSFSGDPVTVSKSFSIDY